MRYEIRLGRAGAQGAGEETHQAGSSRGNASGSPTRRHLGLEGELPPLGQVGNMGQWLRGLERNRAGDLESAGLSHEFESGSPAT